MESCVCLKVKRGSATLNPRGNIEGEKVGSFQQKVLSGRVFLQLCLRYRESPTRTGNTGQHLFLSKGKGFQQIGGFLHTAVFKLKRNPSFENSQELDWIAFYVAD